MQVLKSRLSLNLAYYRKKTIDGILPLSISPSTGYSFQYINAAEIDNNGVEITLGGTPVKTDKFKWNITVNWSKNVNKLVSLYKDVRNIQLGSYQGGVTIDARVGEPYGTIEGTDYVTLDGKPLIDGNGHYVITSTSDNVIGNSQPDWQSGIINNFSYKNWSLAFKIDWSKGGQVFSLDQWYGQATGIYPETVFTNDLGNPVRNSLADGGGTILWGVNSNGEPNSVREDASNYSAFGYYFSPNAKYVYDASYIKLRNVSLTYRMPSSMLKNTFLTGVSFSLVGNNLWIIHKNLPYADPEAGVSSGNLQGWQSGTLPSTRTVGFTVNLEF